MGSDGKLHFTNKAGADTVLNFNNKNATIIMMCVHHDGLVKDYILDLTTEIQLETKPYILNGYKMITDNDSFAIANNQLTANKNGTMIVTGTLSANGGSFHYDKVINGTRTVLNYPYGHVYDVTEIKKDDKIHFVYKNTEAYWFIGTAIVIFESK